MFENISPIWKAEFRGFFLADGCATLLLDHHSRYKSIPLIRPLLAIGLRYDDKNVIDDFKSTLGIGSVSFVECSKYSNTNSRDQFRWYTKSAENILAIIDEILSPSLLPAKKQIDISLVRDFCILRLGMPYRYGEIHRRSLLDFYENVFKVRVAKRKPVASYKEDQVISA
jgi:hypothetical protein